MRTFEGLLWLIVSGWALFRLVRRTTWRADVAFCIASLTLACLQMTLEGVRFHLWPTYALAGALMGLSILQRKRMPVNVMRWRGRVLLGIPLLVFIAAAGLLPVLFPVWSYDQPSGTYGVGTAEYIASGASNERELVIQTWYPITAGAKGTTVGITSRPALLAAAYGSFTGLPAALFDNMRLVRTHALAGAPIAANRQRYPIVLFSHGPLSANRSQSIFMMEALASHGFLAVAIDHTGYASTTIFPDGHTVGPNADAAWPAVVDAKSSAMVRTWVDDVRVVIDRLQALDTSDPSGLLTGRLDLSHIGYVGASFGGSVVVQALLQDPRISAGLAQDGKAYFFDETLTELKRPLMYMQSARPYIQSSGTQLSKWGLTAATFKAAEEDHYARLMQLFARSSGPIYNVYIRGTNHVTFSDLYRIIALPDSQLMDVRRAHRIINDYTIAFFDRYLNDSPALLVDGRTPAPFEEVVVSSRNVVERVAD
jgi:predicted dienelactone hydrolase